MVHLEAVVLQEVEMAQGQRLVATFNTRTLMAADIRDFVQNVGNAMTYCTYQMGNMAAAVSQSQSNSAASGGSVSYTHLTLPTKRIV